MFETITREAGGRRQANDIKEGGRLDLSDILLLTICKLHKHVICEINNECIINEYAWLNCMRTLKTVSGENGFVSYDFQLCRWGLHHLTFIFTRRVEIRQSYDLLRNIGLRVL